MKIVHYRALYVLSVHIGSRFHWMSSLNNEFMRQALTCLIGILVSYYSTPYMLV